MSKSATPPTPTRVLFVCMGNICRSPSAHGVFLHLLRESNLAPSVEVDSAGTHAYHVGSGADERAREAAARRKVSLDFHRARRIEAEDFERFDLIIAMDHQNRKDLAAMAPRKHLAKITMMLDYAPHLGLREVPDPYYGGSTGFERVLDMVEEAARGLLTHIRTLRKQTPGAR